MLTETKAVRREVARLSKPLAETLLPPGHIRRLRESPGQAAESPEDALDAVREESRGPGQLDELAPVMLGIQSLPPRDRLILVGTYFGAISHASLAKLLSLDRTTIIRSLNRSRVRLRLPLDGI